MAIFRSTSSSSQDASSSLRLPATRRITITASDRLSTIVERPKDQTPAPTIPLKSILRYSGQSSLAPPQSSRTSQRTAPPPYGLVDPLIADEEDLTAPVEGEKLAQLRRGDGGGDGHKSRGGWWRLMLVALVILVIIGLAVGLGVGLTVGRNNNNANENSGQTGGDSVSDGASSPQFPLGEFSFVTALHTQQTNCTSEPATWRCYPYTTFSASNSSSLATYNWIITNTSSNYATNSTAATSNQGVPANLTVSSTNNPFAISFINQTLMYISGAGNDSSPRYTFSFNMSKVVVPMPAITSNNAASECFFNSTLFTGTIYLTAPRTYPDAALAGATGIGGYQQWPYAVEVSQVSPGGDGIPDCYEMVNGVATDRIINVLKPQPASGRCICDYRNF